MNLNWGEKISTRRDEKYARRLVGWVSRFVVPESNCIEQREKRRNEDFAQAEKGEEREIAFQGAYIHNLSNYWIQYAVLEGERASEKRVQRTPSPLSQPMLRIPGGWVDLDIMEPNRR